METKPTKENEKILGDVIAQKVKDELELKSNFAQDIVDNCDISKPKLQEDN